MKYLVVIIFVILSFTGCKTSQIYKQDSSKQIVSNETAHEVTKETYYTPEGNVIKTVDKDVVKNKVIKETVYVKIDEKTKRHTLMPYISSFLAGMLFSACGLISAWFIFIRKI